MTDPQPVNVTPDLMYELTTAQLNHVRDCLIAEQGKYSFEDDGGDYNSAMLELADLMFDLTALSSVDTEGLSRLLNTPVNYDWANVNIGTADSSRYVTPLWQLASDGIADAFYNLNCPALPEED